MQEILMLFLKILKKKKSIFKIGLSQLDISARVCYKGRQIWPLFKARKGIQEDKEWNFILEMSEIGNI